MPGSVVAVIATVGERVAHGQPLVVVEAMKMEHTVVAPINGIVEEVLVSIGDRVALNQPLVVVSDEYKEEA
jgi:biotin carboxyl carrier protein